MNTAVLVIRYNQRYKEIFFTFQDGNESDDLTVTVQEPSWSPPDYSLTQHHGLVPGNLLYGATQDLQQLFMAAQSANQETGQGAAKGNKVPCKICGKPISKSNISRHINNVHGIAWNRPDNIK